MAQVTVIILAAGSGKEDDAALPPLLSERNGILLIEQIFRQIDFDARIIIVLQERQAKDESIGSILSVLCPDVEVVLAPGPTAGAACSALLAVDHVDPERELLLLNANEFVEVRPAEVIEVFRSRDLDAGTIVFPSLHPRYCYARVDADDLVEEVSEKRPISRDAVAGFFWWRYGGDFLACAADMVRTRNDVNGHFFVCPTLNEMVLLGKQTGVFRIDRAAYHPLKTEAQSRAFQDGAVA